MTWSLSLGHVDWISGFVLSATRRLASGRKHTRTEKEKLIAVYGVHKYAAKLVSLSYPVHACPVLSCPVFRLALLQTDRQI